MAQITAKLNYLRIAPRKVRLIASTLKNLSVNEAEAQLLFRTQRSSKPILKLLRSAIANAKNNHKLNPDKLFIKNIRVDQGPVLKRFLPRARGRATPIHKRMSHVILVLEENPNLQPFRFTIPVTKKTKLPKKEKKRKPLKKKTEIKKEAPKPQEKVGFLKRIFRRKTV
jgi:large subunit ribosomal protein L22